MKPAAEVAREIATKFITDYRNDFPEVIDKWPKDHPLPNFPGVFDRLALVDLLSERLTAQIEQERAAAWRECREAAEQVAEAELHVAGAQGYSGEPKARDCLRIAKRIRALEPPPERAEKETRT